MSREFSTVGGYVSDDGERDYSLRGTYLSGERATGVPEATGTGTLVSVSAALDASGSVSSAAATGTGTLSSGIAAATGVGVSKSSGTSALSSSTSIVSGAGLARAYGTGALSSGIAAVAGSGVSSSIGTAALPSSVATVSGIGVSRSVATAALNSGAATVSGAGVSKSTGTAALVSGASSSAGVGSGLLGGAGALPSGISALAGAGTSRSFGTAALSSSVAALSGTGLARAIGAGVLVSNAAVASGAAVSRSIGSAALTSQVSGLDGAGGGVVVAGNLLKVWTGIAWVGKPVKVWTGSAWASKPLKYWDGVKWVGGSAPPTAPDEWLITTYTPGYDRDNHTGEVGVRIIPSSNLDVSWIGVRYGGGVATRKVNLYEWSSDALLRTVTIDLTGKPVGEFGWASIEPLTLLMGSYYGLMAETVSGSGATWASRAPVQMKSVISNVYSVYRTPGGSMTPDAQNEMYVGVDLGWDEVEPTDPTGPADVEGLHVWLDASQLVLADGAYVDTWESLVTPLIGTNFNTVPYRPKLRANALNGLAVVRFVAGSGMRWPNHGLDLNWTVIYVGRIWGAAGGRVVSASYPPANIAFGYHGGLEDRVYLEGWLTTGQAQTTNWKLYAGYGDGVPGNASTAFYSNGVLLGGGAPGSQNGGGWKGTFQINGYAPNSGEETCDCEIAEVLIYDRRLDDAERIQVEDYLREKWGL